MSCWYGDSCVSCIEVERGHCAERIAVLEAALREMLESHDGCHLYDDCPALGSPDNECSDDLESPDPRCECGMKATRDRMRAVLEGE
jgi:hypothetical protein